MNKPLLVFAHPGEAAAFLEQTQKAKLDPTVYFSPAIQPLAGKLHTCSTYDVLITGEGIFGAMNKTLLAASQGVKYSSIINLGICAGLNAKLAINDFYKIRTVYAHNGNAPMFQSFPCHELNSDDEIKSADLMSTFDRVLEQAQAKELNIFAPLVDREAYGMAWAAKELNIEFMAYKLISDLPYQNGHEDEAQNICESIKEQSSLFSEKIYYEFQSKIAPYLDSKEHIQSTANNIKSDTYSQLIQNKDMHFTVSMSKALGKSLKKLELKGVDLEKVHLLADGLVKNYPDWRPKQRASELLKAISEMLNPFRTQLSKKLEELINLGLTPQIKDRLNIKWDKDFEKRGFQINTWIENEEHRKQLVDAINSIDLEKFTQIQDGNL